jgi:hypothetical protein
MSKAVVRRTCYMLQANNDTTTVTLRDVSLMSHQSCHRRANFDTPKYLPVRR